MSLTAAWSHLLVTYSTQKIQFYSAALIQTICFWGLSAIYISLPYLAPEFSARHKLQKEEKQPTKQELWECFKVAARNTAFIWLLQAAHLYRSYKRGIPSPFRFEAEFPSAAELICHICIATIIRDIMFYYAHRLLHTKTLYPIFHKKHHRFTAPVAIAAQYTTFTEHLVANAIPIILPCAIMRSHIITWMLFLAKELVSTATTHSGYDFMNGWARFHDLHHENFNVAFGTVGLMDWIHQTDGKVLQQKKREQEKSQ
ncbi:fatty acid hydroxylase [Athelia psychrophila]|uniref:Fatty acid hydroxylase n=1 Tax=Athelia psychrophila TaxID=1759441 RepID=A0A165WFR0_9AGAM|nr:fatty acid hydroxylase [Fibularhizoctonia sp. CBS 109695]